MLLLTLTQEDSQYYHDVCICKAPFLKDSQYYYCNHDHFSSYNCHLSYEENVYTSSSMYRCK